LAVHLEQDFGRETVVRGQDEPPSVSVVPRPGACPLYWLEWGDGLIFGMGEGACRWELSKDSKDIDFVEAAVEAAIAGHVSEVFGPHRSQLTVRLANGVTERASHASAPVGCLPVPFWTRNKRRRKDYLPYGQ